MNNYNTHQHTHYRPTTRSTSTTAVISLVFGILTWIALPVVGALVAVITGHMARKEIASAPQENPIEGDGMAVAGLVLGYVQIALCVAIMLIMLILFAVGFLAAASK